MLFLQFRILYFCWGCPVLNLFDIIRIPIILSMLAFFLLSLIQFYVYVSKDKKSFLFN